MLTQWESNLTLTKGCENVAMFIPKKKKSLAGDNNQNNFLGHSSHSIVAWIIISVHSLLKLYLYL